MTNSFQPSTADLAGIIATLNNSSKWEFQGTTCSTKEYFDEFDADLTALSAEERSRNFDSATVEGSQYDKLTNVPARPCSFGHCLSGGTCVASSYADTEASMKPNYTASSCESLSQYSTLNPTPTNSVDQHVDDKALSSQNDSVEHQQQFALSDFPLHPRGSTPLESWLDTPQRHEQIAYNLSDPAADPIVHQKINKRAGRTISKSK
ncbi:hypothetical protein SBOR_2923 [Sclerotinia borealis F-4128]|uniref:Uncharacterized protein n=1 Tax=Sclerotinia borealis (strain F-4128) TaxID=1432307 RepID=W9CPV2_SCLBF|nr:hypothetical protein SBOR_2923 [Sclerotinia borealis F-4128]